MKKFKEGLKKTKRDFMKSTILEKILMSMAIPVMVLMFIIIPLPIEAWVAIIFLTTLFTIAAVVLAKKQIKESKKLEIGDTVYTKNDFTGVIKSFVTEYDINEDGLEMAVIETKIPKHILTKKIKK